MRTTFHRKSPVLLAVAAAGLLATACGSGEGAVEPTEQVTPEPHSLSHDGTLAVPGKATDGFTYDTKLAPVGTEMAIDMRSFKGKSTFGLKVSGLLPNRGYAAHAHTENCGSNGDIAGPHFQHKPVPKNASDTDPKYANPNNEIWLDLRTDAKGNGSSEAKLPFAITDWSRPKSVVVHAAKKTSTAPGMAGEAGDRIACLTLPHTH
ncbi:MAG: superoxide dismutase [Actinophytocola sp.]|nr:superoxide dismutase [Actinophytocola sp.]